MISVSPLRDETGERPVVQLPRFVYQAHDTAEVAVFPKVIALLAIALGLVALLAVALGLVALLAIALGLGGRTLAQVLLFRRLRLDR